MEDIQRPSDIARLLQDVGIWGQWRRFNPDIRPNLRGAVLRGQELGGADLHNADLSGASMDRAWLVCADFTGADLTKASLKRAELRRADFTGACLGGTRFGKQTLRSSKGIFTLSAGNQMLYVVRHSDGPRIQMNGFWFTVEEAFEKVSGQTDSHGIYRVSLDCACKMANARGWEAPV